MDKAKARETMRTLRNGLGRAERDVLQDQARSQLLSMPEFQQAEWIYPFVSCRSEIDTISLIRFLLEEGKHSVAVPRVRGNDMEFVAIHSMEELVPGAMRILEPIAGTVITADGGLMLMPGLAFDLQGNRVGYGAGYYDRYLEQYDNNRLYKVAYAFDFQIVDQIQAEGHDRRVDAVVTDSRIVRLS